MWSQRAVPQILHDLHAFGRRRCGTGVAPVFPGALVLNATRATVLGADVHLAREPDEQCPIQFSTFRPGTRLNSFVLLVTSVKPS